MDKSFYRSLLLLVCGALLAVTAVAQETACTLTASNGGPYGPATTISLYASSSDPAATYIWTGPNSFSSTEQNPTIANADPINSGIYTVTANGCIGTTEVIVAQPAISIGNYSAQPGPRGTLTPFSFDLMLSYPSGETVTVTTYTQNQTAIAGRDYIATTSTVTFQPYESSKTIMVNVYGTNSTKQKQFVVNLYSPVNGTIAQSNGANVRGQGIILAK